MTGQARPGNPARDLHAVLTKWRKQASGSKTQAQTRVGAAETQSVDQRSFMATHLEAIEALAGVQRALEEMQAAGAGTSYERHLDRWCQIVLAYPHGWQGKVPKDDGYPLLVLDSLESLADLIDARLDAPTVEVELPRIVTSTLEDLFGQIAQALEDDEDLPDNYRSYLDGLVDKIRESFDGADRDHLRALIEELHYALYAGVAKASNGPAFNNVVGTMGSGFFKLVVESIPETAMKMLEAGTSG